MPKRKFDEVEEKGQSDGSESTSADVTASESTSENFEDSGAEDSNSSVHTNSSTDVPSKEARDSNFTSVRKKKQKRNVKFQDVTVFYFPRKQGFVCVPSQGGSTLGMGDNHVVSENYTLSEYTKLQKRIHREILLEQQQQGKLVQNSLLKNHDVDSQQSDSSDSDEDLNVDDYYFLQPVPTRQRRLMLRQSGIKKIDTVEKEDCKDIRTSREMCGCDCRVYCDVDTCQCAQAGIKCQVDRLSFPCGCSKDGCANPTGRVEFNPIRVRTHFIHTVMRLEMERKRAAERQQLKEQLGHISDDDEKSTEDENPEGKTKEELDKLKYNSNEGGSCRDCQKSEMADLILQHTKFATSCSADTKSLSAAVEHGKTVSTDLPGSKVGEVMPQVMMFNDSDDEYSTENGPSMYQFTKGESSYSESSEDCSSEESAPSRHPQDFQSYTSIPTYPNSEGNEEATDTSHPNYCIPQRGSFEPATAQAEGKYMDLASSSSYKLEPISEILNPIRFSGYTSSGNQSWGNCSDSYCTYPSPPVDASHQASLHNNGGSYGDDQSQQEYMFSHSNQVVTPTTSAISCIIPAMAGTDSQFLSQETVSYTANSVQNTSSHSNMTEERDEYQELTSGSARPHGTVIPGKESTQALNGERSERKEYADLESAKIHKMANGNLANSLTKEATKYEDLSNATSKMAPESKYHDLSNVISSSSVDTPLSFTTTNGHALESTDIYGLPQRPSVVAVANPVSPSENAPTGTEPETKQLNPDYNARCQGNSGNQGEDNQTTNFGEIIKESMVETVSA